MKKILLACSFIAVLVSADEYHYSFHKSGIPTVRVEASTGVVEIYSDVHRIKFTEKLLKNFHRQHYSSLKYKDFIQKVKSKYPKLEFKSNETFRWTKHNEFLQIKKLSEFDINLK